MVGAKIRGMDLPDVIAGYQRYDLPNGLGNVQFNRKTVRSWTEGIRTYTVLRQDAIVLTLRYPVSVGSLPFGLSSGATLTAGTTRRLLREPLDLTPARGQGHRSWRSPRVR